MRLAYLYDGVISRSSKLLVARIPRTESKMNASLGSPDTMEYSICPLIPLSASDANTCRKIKAAFKNKTLSLHDSPKKPHHTVYLHDIGVVGLSLPDGCSVAAVFEPRGVVIHVQQVDGDPAVGGLQPVVSQDHQVDVRAQLKIQSVIFLYSDLTLMRTTQQCFTCHSFCSVVKSNLLM